MDPETNRPAYPTTWRNDGERNAYAPDGQLVPPEGIAYMRGLTAREEFAKAAMQGILAASGRPTDTHAIASSDVAALAVRYADATLDHLYNTRTTQS